MKKNKHLLEYLDKFKKWKSDLKVISKKINKPIIYLEDLLEFKEIKGIGYDTRFFKKEYKLRQKRVI